MRDVPGYAVPSYSENEHADALFHYTTASGVLGILRSGQIWSTAYYCANDESELAAGKGILGPIFHTHTHEMVRARHPYVATFARRGMDIRAYAEGYERLLTAFAFSSFCTYLTCFCKPRGEEDFLHGLLSQWRGYGADGGYALQLSRGKLLEEINRSNLEPNKLQYDLLDIHYTPDNDLKSAVWQHKDAFVQAYMTHLAQMESMDFSTNKIPNPLAPLLGGPLERLLNYLINTKSAHFAEERECRLSAVDLVSGEAERQVEFFNRGGLLVPYHATPKERFDILRCIEWIIVGPAPRMSDRFKSLTQLVRSLGLSIQVRPSAIPFSRA